MDAASISNFKQAQLLSAVGLAMTKKTMDTAEQAANALVDMMETISPPSFHKGYEGRA